MIILYIALAILLLTASFCIMMFALQEFEEYKKSLIRKRDHKKLNKNQ